MSSAFMHARSAMIVGGLLLLDGCGSDDDPVGPPNDLSPCTGPVSVTISSGSTPTFSWTPACTIQFLIVEENASDRWDLTALDGRGIAPGVRYGVVPAGARQSDPPIPLAAGKMHEVALYKGLSFADLIAVGSFTP